MWERRYPVREEVHDGHLRLGAVEGAHGDCCFHIARGGRRCRSPATKLVSLLLTIGIDQKVWACARHANEVRQSGKVDNSLDGCA